jgi:hypothetical protein
MTVVKVQITEDRPPGVTIRAHRRILTDCNALVMRYWHRRMLPNHFTTSSKYTYGHKPRTARWNKRKRFLARFRPNLVKKAGIVDNVFSGQLENAARKNISLTAYPNRCTLTMQGPKYMTFRPRHNQPDKGEETTKVIPREMKTLGGVYDRAYTAKIEKVQGRKQTKI